MNLLALDFSTVQRGVCVSAGSGKEAVVTTTDRAAGPLGLIQSALIEAGLQLEEIDALAVGLGPGSYTGIRSSIAIAQGFQLGRIVKLSGISSADVIAHSAAIEGEFAVVIDAQRGEFYCATYRRTNDVVDQTSELRILSPDEIDRLKCPIIGPEQHGITLFPDPGRLAQMAREQAAFVEGHRLEPIYLRPPEFKKAPPPRQID